MTDDVFTIYQKAWAAAEVAGATVRYQSHLPGGYFHPVAQANGAVSPIIGISRPWPEQATKPCRGYSQHAPPGQPPPDIAHELMILAHEYGHLLSWKERTPRARWRQGNAATRKRDEAWGTAPGTISERGARAFPALTDEERALIVEEETTAWEIARELLDDLGFSEWDTFARDREESLQNTRLSLGIALPPKAGGLQ